MLYAGVQINDAYSGVKNSVIESSYRHGILVNMHDYNVVGNNVEVSGNLIKKSGWSGIYGSGLLKRLIIKDNTIERSVHPGMKLKGQIHAVSIDQNLLVGNKSGGITIENEVDKDGNYKTSWNVRIANNTLDHNYWDNSNLSASTRMENVNNAVVSNNIISSSRGYGFLLYDVANSNFMSNSFYKIAPVLVKEQKNFAYLIKLTGQSSRNNNFIGNSYSKNGDQAAQNQISIPAGNLVIDAYNH